MTASHATAFAEWSGAGRTGERGCVVVVVGAGAEPFAEKGTEGGETAGGDTEAAFDVGPEGDFNGCVWVEISRRVWCGVCLGRGWGRRTEEVPIREGMYPGDTDDGSRGGAVGGSLVSFHRLCFKSSEGNIHACHTQNSHHGHFRFMLHMQLAHKEDRQNANGKVAQRREPTVHVGHGDDDLNVHAVAVNVRVKGLASPEVGEWLALQQHDEHEDHASNDGQDHDGPEDPDVETSNSNAHQENADGDFTGNGCKTICDLTKPPVLYLAHVRLNVVEVRGIGVTDLHGGYTLMCIQVFEASSSTIKTASNHAAREHGVEALDILLIRTPWVKRMSIQG